MNSQSTADRISELPDEILHCILGRTDSSTTAEKTVALSQRWRHVWPDFWRSCPDVKFIDHWNSQSFEKLCDATISKFSKDGLLWMRTLKLSLTKKSATGRVRELLELASKRKAEEVKIEGDELILPFRLLSSPAVKNFKFRGVRFSCNTDDDDDLPLFLDSLRFLHLNFVDFDDDRLFANLIASCPLLKTLELGRISNLRKLSLVTGLSRLKTLKIWNISGYVEKIEIAASRLETLHLGGFASFSKFELTAPRLIRLEISYTRLTAGDLEAWISNLQFLKSLKLSNIHLDERNKKMKLSCPKLEEFTLDAPELEEFELKTGLDLPKFLIRIQGLESLDKLKKCEISPPSCRWELDFVHENVYHNSFAALKSFLARFTCFSTVSVTSKANFEKFYVKFIEENAEFVTSPSDIENLKIRENKAVGDDQKAYLNGLLWAMRPKFLTIIYDRKSSYSTSILHSYLTSKKAPPGQKALRGKKLQQLCNWRRRLKDVKIVNRDTDRVVIQEVEERDVRNSVCYMLTWG